jgi:hypothetical protein
LEVWAKRGERVASVCWTGLATEPPRPTLVLVLVVGGPPIYIGGTTTSTRLAV